MDKDLIMTGSGFIAFALIPTPDYVTIISPIAQLIGGSVLIAIGLMTDDKKKGGKK